MAEGVKADDVFLLESFEGSEFEVFPLLLFFLVGFPCLLFLLPNLHLLILVLSPLLILLLPFLGHNHVIFDGLFESIIEQAAVVDERDCHEAAQTGYLLKVHARLTNHLRHKLVGERLDNVFLASIRSQFFAVFLCRFLFALFVKDFVGDDGLLIRKHYIDHELVPSGCVHVLDDFGSFFV